MRDTKFGFAALEERYRVLNGNPIILPRVHFFDLPRILQDIYGKDFASHPRMTGLRRLNTFKEEGYADDFMEGVDEAAAFKNGEFVKLYNSTLKKVDVIAEFAEKAYEGTLKTNYSVWKEFGFSIPAYIELAFENIWFKALTIMGVILSFIQALISFFKQST